jgi:hypothetical protein
MWCRVDLVWTDVSEEHIAWFTQNLYGAASQDTAFFIVTEVKTSNLTQLRIFWPVKDLNSHPSALEQRRYENHFQGNTTRDHIGGCCCAATTDVMGGGALAIVMINLQRRFHQLARRLQRQPEVQKAYVTHMKVFEECGDMWPVQIRAENKQIFFRSSLDF